MLQPSQATGGPGWLDTDRYDIDTAHLQPLLQNLLADRFALKFHWETRDLPVYALVTDNSKAVFKENRDAPITVLNTRTGSGKIRIVGTKVSMEQLARSIGSEMGSVVVDKQGLPGGYDVNLEWSHSESGSLAPSIFTELHEHLGLKLEPAKAPVKVLVVDSAEKATAN